MAWTQVPKPEATSSILTFTGGEPIGLLLSLTASQTSVISGGDDWTQVSVAGVGTWTSIATAT